jgi:hypothetical protein
MLSNLYGTKSGGDTSDLDQVSIGICVRVEITCGCAQELATLEADLANKKKLLNLKMQQQDKVCVCGLSVGAMALSSHSRAQMMEKLQVSNLVDALAKLATYDAH